MRFQPRHKIIVIMEYTPIIIAFYNSVKKKIKLSELKID